MAPSLGKNSPKQIALRSHTPNGSRNNLHPCRQQKNEHGVEGHPEQNRHHVPGLRRTTGKTRASHVHERLGTKAQRILAIQRTRHSRGQRATSITKAKLSMDVLVTSVAAIMTRMGGAVAPFYEARMRP